MGKKNTRMAVAAGDDLLEECPQEWICVITGELFRDPVVTCDGHTYERLAIEEWLRNHSTSPKTNEPLQHKLLVPNHALRQTIEEWREQTPLTIQSHRLRLNWDECIGQGAFGKVVTGLLDGHSRVAVKVLPLSRQDFDKELKAHIHASRHCDGICVLHGTCCMQGKSCIVMKLYTSSLAEEISRGPLDIRVARAYAHTLFRTLRQLHEVHLIVRDIKPANILIDEYGEVVIADFGISEVARTHTHVIVPSCVKGTYNYMAPEMIDPDLFRTGVGAPSDVWSLACVVIEMVSGKQPWQGLQIPQIVSKVVHRKEVPPVPETAPAYCLLRECFSFLPVDRPAAAKLVDALAPTFSESIPVDTQHGGTVAEDIRRDSASMDIKSCSCSASMEARFDATFEEEDFLQPLPPISASANMRFEATCDNESFAGAPAFAVEAETSSSSSQSFGMLEKWADSMESLEVEAAENIMSVLRKGTFFQKLHVAQMISKSNTSDDVLNVLAEAGAIQQLVAFSAEGCIQGIHALHRMVLMNEKNKIEVLEAGGVFSLCQLIASGDDEMKQASIGLLAILGLKNDEIRRSIATSGGIPHLVLLLRNGSSQLKLVAAGAMQVLSQNCENKAVIAQCGGVESLIAVLACESDACQMAAGALRELVGGNDFIKAIIIQCNGIPAIVGVLQKGPSEAKLFATLIMEEISYKNPNNVRSIITAGGLLPLKELLHNGIVKQKEATTVVLWNISDAEGMSNRLVEAGFTGLLIQELLTGTDCSRLAVAHVITNITEHAHSHYISEVVEANVVPALIFVLQNTACNETRECVLHALSNLVQDFGDALAENGGILAIVELIDAGSPLLVVVAATLTKIASVSEKNRDLIEDAGAIPRLLHLLDYGSSGEKGVAHTFLKSLERSSFCGS